MQYASVVDIEKTVIIEERKTQPSKEVRIFGQQLLSFGNIANMIKERNSQVNRQEKSKNRHLRSTSYLKKY